MARKQLASQLDIACDACLAQLREYVDRELAGEPVTNIFPTVTYHIETCQACEAQYYRMFHAQGMQMSEDALRSIRDRDGLSAQFDAILASLPAVDDWDASSVAQGRAWYDRATSRLRQLEIYLAGLFVRASLGPADVLTGLQGAPLAADASAAQGASIVEGDLEMSLRVSPDPAGDASLCRIEVAVNLQDRFGDYSGVELILADTVGERTAMTGEDGIAHFDRVPRDELPSLSLTIRTPD